MTANEIRQAFLDHFAQRGHRIVPSAPMVIKDDPTLMFTNAGMNPFKDIFLGNREPADRRVADTQKCLRVSGKHNDLEEVGIDTYHHTMFEMLGNWSFGDYFKAEAIQWAWELLVDTFQIDPARLYVTYFGGDEADGLEPDTEARDLWKKHLPEDRIMPFSRKDNFWEMGDTGPCGPCSEIHVDIRSEAERKARPGSELVNADHPQVIEVWNLVFMQFDRKADGSLKDLPARHVDTGMGFERLCMVLQGKQSNYDTDVFQPLIQALAKRSGRVYGQGPGSGAGDKADIAMRVCADHLRAIAFAIADGQLPGNTGAGYVIRRILRRAVRYGYSFLGLEEPFLNELVPVLVGQLGGQFPELKKQQELIVNVVQEEEKSFLRTLEQGTKRLEQLIAESGKKLPGDKAFELYDTYGFPIDLTQLMCREQGVEVDMAGFEAELKQQKDRSRAATAVQAGDWTELGAGEPVFTGYDELEGEARILRHRKVSGKGGDRYQVVLDRTPFYPEGGGQVGDTGWLVQGEARVEVLDTKRENELIVHFCKALPPDPSLPVIARVDADRRRSTMRNHSATHLLHHALRKHLGTHVEQKGSLVAPDRLRFDISHFAKITPEELAAVEADVNAQIRADEQLKEQREVSMAEAQAQGAMALFGEKYGDRVRTIRFGDSIELCGGTHVAHTGDIGQLRIVGESALAAGIRRLEAITGAAADAWVNERLEQLEAIKDRLKQPQDPVAAVEQLLSRNTALEKEVEQAAKERVAALSKDILNDARAVNGARLLAKEVDLDAQGMKDLAFRLKDANPDLLMVLGGRHDGKALLTVLVGQQLIDERGLKATDVVKQLASEIKGGGGGQPFLATAGGKDPDGIPRALAKAAALLD